MTINLDEVRAKMYPGLQLQATMAVRLAVLQQSIAKSLGAGAIDHAIASEYQAILNRLRATYGLGVR